MKRFNHICPFCESKFTQKASLKDKISYKIQMFIRKAKRFNLKEWMTIQYYCLFPFAE